MRLDKLIEAAQVAPLVPVLVINDLDKAAPLARALYEGGLRIAEVTLHTEQGVAAIKEMKTSVPELIVGAGTILTAAHVEACRIAGSDFLVSPGMAPGLLEGLGSERGDMIPGVATASEAMARAEEGFEILKLFPAAVAGGPAALKAIAGPLGHLKFMPTGGVSEANMKDYLSLSNVVAVGGSWMAKREDVEAGRWGKISELCSAALAQCH